MANTHAADLEVDSSQGFTASDSASLSLTGDLTLEMWLKLESQPGSGVVNNLIHKWTGGGDQRAYRFRYNDNGGTKRFSFQNSSDGTTPGSSIAHVNFELVVGSLTHVACVYDASAGSWELFINGRSEGTGTGMETSIFDSTAIFIIGGPGVEYDGVIDDIRIWSETKTATQLADSSSKELAGTETNLEAYWKLNDSLLDETSNNNDLTNLNSTSFVTELPFVVEFQSEASAVTGDGNFQSLTITKPPGTVKNDLLLAWLVTDGAETHAAPTGWDEVQQTQNGSVCTLSVWEKIAGDSEAADYAFTWSTNEEGAGGIMRFNNVDQTTPIDISASGTGTDGSPVAPTVTTTVIDTMIVRFFGADDDDLNTDTDDTFPTDNVGMQVEKSSATAGSCSGAASREPQEAIAATGTATFDLTATEEWVGITVAIRLAVNREHPFRRPTPNQVAMLVR